MNNFSFESFSRCKIKDKKRQTFERVIYAVNQCVEMFKWSGLPDTCPPKIFEQQQIVQGYSILLKPDGYSSFVPFYGGLGNIPNVYYLPTTSIVANPALDKTYTCCIHGNEKYLNKKGVYYDGISVLAKNDTNNIGLFPLINRYCSEMTEALISLNRNAVNTRAQFLIGANTADEKKQADIFLSNIENGESASVMNNPFFEGIKSQPLSGNNQNITSLIEYIQYLDGKMWQSLGLNSSFNMKREALNRNEIEQNFEIMIPQIDNMLFHRKETCKQVKEVFGIDVDVDVSSSWKENQAELEKQIEILEEGVPVDNMSENP